MSRPAALPVVEKLRLLSDAMIPQVSPAFSVETPLYLVIKLSTNQLIHITGWTHFLASNNKEAVTTQVNDHPKF